MSRSRIAVFLNSYAISLTEAMRVAALAGLFAATSWAQTSNAVAALGTYRIAGTIVSKADGHPLARAKVMVRDTKEAKNSQTLITKEDGKYEFNGLAAGKYSLIGSRRGFISARYDQHDQYSTAIVTGAGLDTEALVLKLASDTVITGKVLDESGEPVRRANVTLYYNDHSSGVDQIRQFRAAQTDDLGEYEFTPIIPGTYYLSANGTPWYAVHPPSHQAASDSTGEQTTQGPSAVDRSLDVAYPVTYYPNVTEVEEAQPIPVRGGDRIEADFHLAPVPSLHLLFRLPGDANHGYAFPQLEQTGFDGSSTFVQSSGGTMITQGVMEITGIPAGRYNVRLQQQGNSFRMNGIDLTKDGEEIDTSKSEVASSVKFSVRVAGEAALPPQLIVGLRSANRSVTAAQPVDTKGEVEFADVAAGRYEIVIFGGGKPYAISHASAEGGDVSGHTLSVTAGSSASVSITVLEGSVEVEGVVKKKGKGFAGAMVVLVPKNAQEDRDLFRRDQSDLDGTFLLRNVVPGAYTILAIEDGWDLDWSRPGVIAAYLKRGRQIQVGDRTGKSSSLRVAEAVEVQTK